MSSPPVSFRRPSSRIDSLAEGVRETADPGTMPLSLMGLEFSLDTASLDALEAVTRSLSKPRLREGFDQIPETEEVALLTTCHRVELVFLASSPGALDRWRERLPGDPGSWKPREGREVVHHLFRVAAGRESLAVGEAEVRHQVRRAATSVESRHPRSVLRELLVGAAAAGDELCATVPPSRSIAAVAVARLLDLLPSAHPAVLVIGSGTIGRQVVEHLSPFARVTIAYHQKPPEDAFLAGTGARAVGLDRLGPELAESDAVVTAAKLGDHGVRVHDLPRERPIVLVDLGVPRNIDPAARSLTNVRLVDLEELHTLASRPADDATEDVRLAELADRFSVRVERLLLEPWIDTLRRAAEEVRRSELSSARPFLGPLSPEQEVAIDRLTRRLVTRLLLTPTERIRSLPPGPEGDLRRRFAVALLDPAPPDS
jgi:glutamyl-tRNA reductase